jgi:hypothetical protein
MPPGNVAHPKMGPAVARCLFKIANLFAQSRISEMAGPGAITATLGMGSLARGQRRAHLCLLLRAYDLGAADAEVEQQTLVPAKADAAQNG